MNKGLKSFVENSLNLIFLLSKKMTFQQQVMCLTLMAICNSYICQFVITVLYCSIGSNTEFKWLEQIINLNNLGEPFSSLMNHHFLV